MTESHVTVAPSTPCTPSTASTVSAAGTPRNGLGHRIVRALRNVARAVDTAHAIRHGVASTATDTGTARRPTPADVVWVAHLGPERATLPRD